MSKSHSLTGIFRALRNPNYRLFFIGQTISLIGTWMQSVALSWLVYRLTNSPALLGITAFLGQLPNLLFTPLAGVVADRCQRRNVLLLTQIASLIQASTLAILVLTGHIQVWHIILLAFCLGTVNAFDIPVRQSFTIEMLEHRDDLANTIALNSSMVNMAKLIGPSIAGFFIAFWGEGVCFAFNALSYVAVIGSLLLMQIKIRHVHRSGHPILKDIVDGFKYVTDFLPIKYILLLLGFISFIGAPYQILMPVFARDIFGGGPKTLGVLMGCSGLGALFGAVYLAGRKTVLGLTRLIAVSAVIFGAAIIVFSYMPVFIIALTMVCVGSFAMMVCMASCNTILQTISPEDKRGRVMSFYTMAFIGTIPFGGLLTAGCVGWLGVKNTELFCGISAVIAGILFYRALPVLRNGINPIYLQKGILNTFKEGL